jgi:hypothetical protein
MTELAKVETVKTEEKVGKEKKVTLREVLRAELAEILKEKEGLAKIGRTKEGLVVVRGDETAIVRVILKKEAVEAKDILETL